MVATKECWLTSSLICFTEGNWRFESHFCETKNVSSTDGQLTICIAKRLRMWLTKMAGTSDPLRGASVRRPSPPLPRCYLSPQQPQTGTGRRIPWCASIERPQRHCGVQEVLLKKKQSNYKGRTNCYKVIISWEKNPLNLWILRLFWRKLLCQLFESWNLRSV